ncbi:hypothetical protein ABIF86_002322 [Bradyrhizobium japonicum]
MTSPYYLAMAALLGLVTTSSSLIGAAIGLHAPFSKCPQAPHLNLVASPGNDAGNPSIALQCEQTKKRPGCSGSSNPGLNRNRRSPVMSVLPKST